MVLSNENLDFHKPVPLVKQIYNSIAEAISQGNLQPGQLLKEVDLQKAFSVSRAPIREAIRLLEADGLVVVDAYKKKYVRNITYKYIQELIPVLSRLEGCAKKSTIFSAGFSKDRACRPFPRKSFLCRVSMSRKAPRPLK